MSAEVFSPEQGRYGAKCDECDWTDSATSTMRTLAQKDADKHNDEKHGGASEFIQSPNREGHWYTR